MPIVQQNHTEGLCNPDSGPAFWRRVEETLLVGKVEDFDALIACLSESEDFPSDLRYGIEGLYHFRTHYRDPSLGLSEDAKGRIMKMDADWTMQLLRDLHEKFQQSSQYTA